jgi:lipopolysaccharide cholinephosphotransferase
MTALQQRLYTLLLEVDRICGIHGITYYLIGGTALGAVRHKGFIPWDDDLDVGMLRPEYERFLRLCGETLGPKFFLQYWRTEPTYFLPFARIRLNGTTFLSPGHEHLPLHQGIYLDIFPLDGLPKRRWIARLQRKVQRGLHALLMVKFMNLPKPRLRNRLLTRFLRPLLPGAQINRFYNFTAKLFPVETASNIVFLSLLKNRPIYPREWFAAPVYMLFEEHQFPMPTNWHAFLERTFGDYMIPPPVEERVFNHATVIDPDRDYRHYLK